MNTNDDRITLILIDTCAFRDANSDFLGIKRKLLPTFFETAEEKGIILLTHPVLENEIKKHIADSGLYKDYNALINQLCKCSEMLKHFNCNNETLFSQISGLDIQDKLFEGYQKHYRNAIHLDFCNPSVVFSLYFDGKPPFAVSGKKKSEFPDAFVYESTKQYMENHLNDVLLVVSKDPDWINAFGSMDNVIVCESISDAQTKISCIDSILSQEMIREIFSGAYQEIVTDAQMRIESECFELSDYETYIELEIESVTIENICDDITPLKITRDSLLLNTTIEIKVSGHAEVFDEENSIWDSIDGEYVYMSYSDIDFVDAKVEIECEILISFDFDDPEGTAQVASFILLNQGNICIDCRDATAVQVSEDEMAIRALREDKGYPRRTVK